MLLFYSGLYLFTVCICTCVYAIFPMLARSTSFDLTTKSPFQTQTHSYSPRILMGWISHSSWQCFQWACNYGLIAFVRKCDKTKCVLSGRYFQKLPSTFTNCVLLYLLHTSWPFLKHVPLKFRWESSASIILGQSGSWRIVRLGLGSLVARAGHLPLCLSLHHLNVLGSSVNSGFPSSFVLHCSLIVLIF